MHFGARSLSVKIIAYGLLCAKQWSKPMVTPHPWHHKEQNTMKHIKLRVFHWRSYIKISSTNFKWGNVRIAAIPASSSLKVMSIEVVCSVQATLDKWGMIENGACKSGLSGSMLVKIGFKLCICPGAFKCTKVHTWVMSGVCIDIE